MPSTVCGANLWAPVARKDAIDYSLVKQIMECVTWERDHIVDRIRQFKNRYSVEYLPASADRDIESQAAKEKECERVPIDARDALLYANTSSDIRFSMQVWDGWPEGHRRKVPVPHDFIMQRANCECIVDMLHRSGDIGPAI